MEIPSVHYPQNDDGGVVGGRVMCQGARTRGAAPCPPVELRSRGCPRGFAGWEFTVGAKIKDLLPALLECFALTSVSGHRPLWLQYSLSDTGSFMSWCHPQLGHRRKSAEVAAPTCPAVDRARPAQARGSPPGLKARFRVRSGFQRTDTGDLWRAG